MILHARLRLWDPYKIIVLLLVRLSFLLSRSPSIALLFHKDLCILWAPAALTTQITFSSVWGTGSLPLKPWATLLLLFGVLFYPLVSKLEGLFPRVEPMPFSSMVNQGLMGRRASILQGLSGLTCTCSVVGASPTEVLKPSEEQRYGRDGWNLPHKN